MFSEQFFEISLLTRLLGYPLLTAMVLIIFSSENLSVPEKGNKKDFMNHRILCS